MSDAAVEALRATNFSVLDWVIVASYLCVSVAIGFYVKRFATSMDSYVGAGRSVGMWLGVATMTGTELGLVTVMYAAETGFKNGFAAFHIAVIAGFVTLLVGLSGLIIAPLRRACVLTIPEFYELRFGRSTRIMGGIILSFAGILNMGLFLKMGSLFIVGITGITTEGPALTIVMTVLLALVLIYTVLGGMVSVIITDYIQFVVLSLGLVITTFLAIYHLGWENIFQTVREHKGDAGFDPLVASGFGGDYVAWMMVLGLVGCAIWPTAVARALAMESETAVKRQFTISSISFVIRMMVPNFWGICAFVFIATSGGTLTQLFLAENAELTPMQAMPVFLGRILPIGVIGFITAAMVAAFMSTHDSYLLCWSSVLTQDVVAPLCKNELSTQARIRLTRVFIVLIGAFIWWWGLFYEGSDDIWSYMAITGAIYFVGAIALLIGGIYWSRASTAGANLGLLGGCSAILGLEPIRRQIAELHIRMTESNLEVDELIQSTYSSERFGLIAIAITGAFFIVGSLILPDKEPKDVFGKLKK